jgi:hypothetical protein
MAYQTSQSGADDYSGVDPLVMAAAEAHIAHKRCERHLRRSLDAMEAGAPCGSLLRLAPLGKRVAYQHKGHTVVALQCVEWGHGQVLTL